MNSWERLWAEPPERKPPAGEPSPLREPGGTPYGRAALTAEVQKVAAADDGTRNDTLNKAGFNLAQLVAAGHLDHNDVHQQLTSAALAVGLPDKEIAATLRSSLTAGVQQPRDVPDRPPPHQPDDGADLTPEAEQATASRHLELTPASAIKPQRVRWAWQHRMALGTLGLLGGREGSGKSTLAYWAAARITRGELPGEYHGTPRGVLICATEDSWAHTIVPRLIAAGADLDKVFRVEVITADNIHVGLTLPRDVHKVEEAVTETDAAMLLLDPLMSRVDAKLDTHRDGELRQALEPIAALADRTGLLVLGIIHFNKTGSTDVLDRIMGSKAFVAVARSVSVVVPDPDDESGQRRLFGTPKNNLGRTDLPSLSFTIASHTLDTDDGPTSVGQVKFGDESDVTVTEAMERIGEDADVRTATGEAKEWLRDYLTARGGSAEREEVQAAAAKAKHAERTLYRARKQLHVISEPVPGGTRRMWSLPTPRKGSAEKVPASPWGDGIDGKDGKDAGQSVSGANDGNELFAMFANPAMPPREVAQTADTDTLIGTCGRCQQPNTPLVGVDHRGRPACSDCTARRRRP